MATPQTGRKPAAALDPRRMAALAVERWFDSVTASADAFTHGHINSVSLEADFYEVRETLEVEFLKRSRFSDNEQDRITEHQIIAIEAGYLMGVQVGLRLREKGGR